MYGIIHKSIFDSTLIAEGHEVTYVFMCMVSLADEEDICDLDISALARRINMPLGQVEHAIKRLCSPDLGSKLKEHEGRRIISLQDFQDIESNRGWFITNREHYIQEAKKQNRKKTNARYYAKNYDNKIKNILDTDISDKDKTHIDIDVNVLKEGDKSPPDNPKDIVWQEGVKLGIARNLLGKLCKEYSETAVAQAVLKTKEHSPAEPKSYIIGILKKQDSDPFWGAI
jgi:hypothetical protein